ncbi:MAG: DUF6088 family protein [Oligosphaeraceae bacterium]
MKSVKERIKNHIELLEAGYVFSAKDFLREFRRYEVDVALSTLAKEGFIRRVIPGIYERPRLNPLLGTQSAPDLYGVAKALARKFSWRIHPSGNAALNLLGLSTQIPGRMVFHSDGPSKKYTIGNRDIEFKHISQHELVFSLPESGLVVQALKALGKEHVDQKVIECLHKSYTNTLWKKISDDTCNASGWIHEIVRKISTQEVNNAANYTT